MTDSSLAWVRQRLPDRDACDGIFPRIERGHDYLVGLDLGQAHDFSAWVVAQRTNQAGQACYDVVHIDRVRGATYPAVVTHTEALIGALRAQTPRPTVELVVDFTGVGRPVAELLLEAHLDATTITLVTITGGDAVTRGERDDWRVPKRELASVIQVLLQADRLRIAEALPLARILTEELVNFRVKISLAGHDSYGAGADWRDGNHDDLVLALGLASWRGERRMTPGIWVLD
jgi:hypothetical protein